MFERNVSKHSSPGGPNLPTLAPTAPIVARPSVARLRRSHRSLLGLKSPESAHCADRRSGIRRPATEVVLLVPRDQFNLFPGYLYVWERHRFLYNHNEEGESATFAPFSHPLSVHLTPALVSCLHGSYWSNKGDSASIIGYYCE